MASTPSMRRFGSTSWGLPSRGGEEVGQRENWPGFYIEKRFIDAQCSDYHCTWSRESLEARKSLRGAPAHVDPGTIQEYAQTRWEVRAVHRTNFSEWDIDGS